MQKKHRSIIAADIGGTNSRFALFTWEEKLEIRERIEIPTQSTKSFAELLENLEASSFPLALSEADAVSFAIAGPVSNGVYCSPPNIPWAVDLSNAQRDFGLNNFLLINDFLAQAYAVLSPIGNSKTTINAGKADPAGTIAVLGAGTGVGKALLVPTTSGHYRGIPSEGGHGNFPPENERELELSAFIKAKDSLAYTSWDDTISGRGLSHIHEFCNGVEISPKEVADTFEKNSETLQIAATIYGRLCRNFALEGLSTGGMYIAGGLAAKNPILLEHPSFEQSFLDSPKYRDLLKTMPLHLFENEASGLWGAAHAAQIPTV